MQKKLGPLASVRRGEREEELTLFHEVRRREHERKSNAIHPLPPHDADLGTPDYSIQHHEASSASKMTLCYASGNPVVIESLPSDLTERGDDLLSAELGKNDYDWLLTPPGTPSYKHSIHNSASDHSDFLSRAKPLSLVQSLAAIKTSRFSSTKMEPNLMKDGPTVLKNSELASRKGQNGVYGSNGLSAGSSMFSTNSITASSSKKTPLTPRSGSASRPTSPAKRTLASSAHTPNPSIPASKSKHSSAPGSHPTTPTSRYTASKGGGNSVFSSSTPSRKTGPSSPAMSSFKRLSPSPTQNQPLSAGVSRSSSVNKSRPQPSRSAPSSRGNSPRGSPHDWPQAFSSNSQSVTTTTPTPNSYLSSNLTTPTSLNQRASGVGSSPRPGATSSTRQALFPSLNQLETSMDIQKKACSPSFTRGKCALLKMDRQTSSGSIMSRSSMQLDKSKGDSMTVSIKMEDKMIHTMRPLGSSVLSDTTCSGVQAKYPLEKYTSLTTNGDHGFSKHASGRSLDMAMEHVSLHRDASNAFCPPVVSKPVQSLWSTRNVVAQDCSNSVFIAENSKMKADVKVIASHGQGGGEQSEEFKYRSDFKVLLADQTDILSSFVKDDNMDNWLDSPVYMNEGPDLMKIFDQGLGKFGSCESPLVCPHGGGAVTCDLCSVKLRLQMLNEKSKASFGANSQILSEA